MHKHSLAIKSHVITDIANSIDLLCNDLIAVIVTMSACSLLAVMVVAVLAFSSTTEAEHVRCQHYSRWEALVESYRLMKSKTFSVLQGRTGRAYSLDSLICTMKKSQGMDKMDEMGRQSMAMELMGQAARCKYGRCMV